MSGNGKQKTRHKHSQRNQPRARKRLSQPVLIAALKAHERRENHQRCRQDIPDRDAIDKDFLRQPLSAEHGLDLHKWDSSVCTPKRQGACDEAEGE